MIMSSQLDWDLVLAEGQSTDVILKKRMRCDREREWLMRCDRERERLMSCSTADDEEFGDLITLVLAPTLVAAPGQKTDDPTVTSGLLTTAFHAAAGHCRTDRLHFVEGEVLVAVVAAPAVAILPHEVVSCRTHIVGPGDLCKLNGAPHCGALRRHGSTSLLCAVVDDLFGLLDGVTVSCVACQADPLFETEMPSSGTRGQDCCAVLDRACRVVAYQLQSGGPGLETVFIFL